MRLERAPVAHSAGLLHDLAVGRDDVACAGLPSIQKPYSSSDMNFGGGHVRGIIALPVQITADPAGRTS